MPRLRLAAVSLNQTPLDWDGNFNRIADAIAAARNDGADVLCLPELCITGYGCEDAFFSAGVQTTALEMLAELTAQSGGITTCLGLPLLIDGGLYNVAALACDKRLVGAVCKQHLAGDGIHYEPRWFRCWPRGVVQRIDLAGRDIPVGDLVFDIDGVKIGVEVCRDAWVAERTGALLAARGADVLLNPSASHFAFGKQEVRRRIALEGSRTMQLSTAFCNLLGNESGRAIYDGGSIIASCGQVLAEGSRLSFAESSAAFADVDVAVTRRRRAAGSEPTPPSAALAGETIRCTYSALRRQVLLPPSSASGWTSSDQTKYEEFARSVALGLFDYLRKSGAKGFVVSLSGGADSSAVATLVWLMVKLGIAELGRETFAARLSHVPGLDAASGDEEAVGCLLACAYQATRNSSAQTRNAAAAVAEAIGADFFEWQVDSMIDDYVGVASRVAGRKLAWETDDLALQNIQARARGPGVWLLANMRGALLLSTSNRSEAAVGYATMDGDTCGGLAPIAGIDKAFLLDWLQ